MAHDHSHQHPDQWHRHTPDEGTPQPEHAARANPAVLGVAMTLLTIAFVATVIIVILFYNHVAAATRATRMETSTPANQWYDYHNRSMERLAGYELVNADESDAVRIPIDLAMERVVESYAGPRRNPESPASQKQP